MARLQGVNFIKSFHVMFGETHCIEFVSGINATIEHLVYGPRGLPIILPCLTLQ